MKEYVRRMQDMCGLKAKKELAEAKQKQQFRVAQVCRIPFSVPLEYTTAVLGMFGCSVSYSNAGRLIARAL